MVLSRHVRSAVWLYRNAALAWNPGTVLNHHHQFCAHYLSAHWPQAITGPLIQQELCELTSNSSKREKLWRLHKPHHSGTSFSVPDKTSVSPHAAGHTPSRRQRFRSPVQPTKIWTGGGNAVSSKLKPGDAHSLFLREVSLCLYIVINRHRGGVNKMHTCCELSANAGKCLPIKKHQ